MSIRNLILSASMVLSASCALAQGASQAVPLRLSEALQAADQNFDVAAALAALDGARSDVLAADHAPLPVLSAKAGSIDLQNGVGSGSFLTQKRIDKSVGLDWAWERGNKRSLRTAAAQANVGAAQADVRDMRQQQKVLALSGYVDLWGAQQRVQEVRAMGEGAQAMVSAMRLRLRVGDVSAQDLARAEIEASKARLDLDAAELDRQRAALSLAQILGRGQESLLAADDFSRGIDPQAWAELPAERINQAVANRADVQAAEARVQAAQAQIDSASAARKSDITWGVSVDHFPGTSTRQVELRMQMPLQWGYSQEGEVGRALAQLKQAQELAARVRSLAQAEIIRLWQEARGSSVTVQAYQVDILPRARQVLAQAELAYKKGALTFTDLLDARRALRASLLDELTARVTYLRAEGAWRLRSAL